MLISTEKEQISLPLDNGTVSLKSSLMGSDPDSLDGLPPATELPESPPLPTVYTDVNVVPEYEKNELEQTISSLEDEIVGLKLKQRSLDQKRRHALNRILDIKGAIRVFCRIRPFLSKDGSQIHQPVSVVSEKIVVRSAGSKKEFGFDKVFPQQASQEDVFVEVEPILKSALDGNNVCIMAYGQTGTGKTYTMDGTNHQPGIVTQALKELFHRASLDSTASFTFSMSMLEVYMGNLRDLLAPKTSYKAYEEISRVNLNIQTDPKGSVEIEGLTEVQIPDFTKASWWYAKGRRVRSTSWTNVNEASSRSHCLTRITIYRRGDIKEHKMEVTKLWMIDLGGSERLLKTGATGQILDEGRAINLSISALGDVIAALRRKRSHVPYRNSKLTQILKDSLGDGSKVLMLVHVSPCEYDIGETTCSLSFAKRASAIESNRELQEDLKMLREKRIAQLEEEMGKADEECKKVGDQIQKVEFLLIEKKQLFSASYGLVEDEILAPKNPKEDLRESLGTPQTSGKAIRRNISSSLPRFMSPTAASRQRQSAAERVVVGRARTSTSVTISSIHFSASQSVSYSDPRFKALLRNSSNKKARYGEETKTILTESPKCSGSMDSKKQSMPLSKMVTSSNPNLRVTLSRHRRRMSNLI